MFVTSFVGQYWSNNLLVDEESLETKLLRLPLPPAHFLSGASPVSFFSNLKESFGVKDVEIYTVFSKSSSFEPGKTKEGIRSCYVSDALSALDFKKPFLWIEEERYFTKGKSGTIGTSPTLIFNHFFLENNYFVSENMWQNRLIYGPRLPTSDYERSFEDAILRSRIYATTQIVYEDLFRNNREIFLTGPFYNLGDSIPKVLLSLANSINSPGFWDVSIDTNDIFTSLLPLARFNKGIFAKVYRKLFPPKSASVLIIPDAESVELDFGIDEITKTEIGGEGLSLIPIPGTGEVKITVSLKGKKKGFNTTIAGSRYGLLLDGRKRPLLEADSKARLRRSFEASLEMLKGKLS